MKTGSYISANRESRTTHICLAQIFDRYCLDPEQLYILKVHGCMMGLIDYGQDLYNPQRSNLRNINNGIKPICGLFANIISKIGVYDSNGRGNSKNSEFGYGNYRQSPNNKNKSKGSKLKDKSNCDSKSPLRKRNNNSNTKNNNQTDYYSINAICYENGSNSDQLMVQNKQNYSHRNNSYNSSQGQQYVRVPGSGQVERSKTNFTGMGCNGYKIISKPNNNKSKQKESINKNYDSRNTQQRAKFSLSSINSRSQKELKIKSELIVHENIVDLSFQNLDYFAQNFSIQPRVGEIIPPIHSMRSFGKELAQKQEYLQNRQQRQSITKEKENADLIKQQQKKQSKVEIQISDSDPSLSDRKIRNFGQSNKIFNKQQNIGKQSIIQSLLGFKSSRKQLQPIKEQFQKQKHSLQYRTPDLHDSLRKQKYDKIIQNLENNKKSSEVKFYQNVKNPYVEQYKQSQQQVIDKYKKLSDEQVVQIISSRKKSTLIKKEQKSNTSNLQIKNENKLLDLSDLDIDALLKIRKIESVMKSDNRESDIKVGNLNVVSKVQMSDQKILSKNGNIINVQQKLQSKIRFFIKHPDQNKNVQIENQTPKQQKNAQNHSSSNLLPNPTQLNASFVPHYRLSPSYPQISINRSNWNQFVPSNINATKPAQSTLYQARRHSQQSQALSSIVFELSANSNF